MKPKKEEPAEFIEEIRNSDEVKRLIFEFAPDTVYLNDLKGNFIDGNRAAERLTGYKREELIGKSFFKLNLLSKTDMIKAAASLARIAAGKPAGPEEYTVNRKDGKKAIAEISSYPLKIKGKTISLGIARDITERKKSEGEYKTIIRTSIDGFWIVDMEGHFLDVNDAYCRLIGYSRDELLKMRISDVEVKEKPGETAQHIQKIMKAGGDRFETQHRCKDGRIVDVEVSVNYMKEAGNMFVFLRDITERKKADMIARQSEQNISQIIQGSSVPTFVIGRNHKVLCWNKACENLTGITADKMIGKDTQWSAFYKEKRPLMADLIMGSAKESEIDKLYEGKSKKSSVLEGAYEADRFFPNLGKEGKWLFFTAAPIKNEKGETIGALETLQDITERKKAEEEGRKRNEELERFNKLAVGRELMMIELKKKIAGLEGRLKEKEG